MMLAGLAGDASAYRRLLEELSLYLRAYFIRRLGDRGKADAEDLVQETLMAVHAKRATYDVERPFTAWLHAVAKYKLADHYRRGRRRVTVSLDDVDEPFAPDEATAAMAYYDVQRLLQTLPEAKQALIRRVRIEGQSVAEASASTGMSESSVKVTIHRGLKALGSRLKGGSGG